MNLTQFFEHWGVVENPFRGEEARHDAVFSRLSDRGVRAAAHSDFEKILGDLSHPSTAIVFGEKGSGKTAMRLLIAARVDAYNASRPDGRVLCIAYDDLNSTLDAYHARSGAKDPRESFAKLRLVDHVDGLLGVIVPRLVDAALGAPPAAGGIDLGPEPRARFRRLDRALRGDMLLLQALYDRAGGVDGGTPERTRRLRRALRIRIARSTLIWNALVVLGMLVPAGVAAAFFRWTDRVVTFPWIVGFAAAVVLWLLIVLKRVAWDRAVVARLARRIRKQIRVTSRSSGSYAGSLELVPPADRPSSLIPLTDSDETRYALFDRARRVLDAVGYSGLIIVVDRVDEPTLVSGDPARMQAIVWPLLNNKFLQQERVGVKMLLPIELRHALLKESSAFFQEARLDKQGLIERLAWTGALLFDLCEARLAACRAPEAAPIGLLDLFAPEVTRQDLVDALDQMHQPRDAFKFLYRCIAEHCSNVTAGESEWKIPRLVLESVRKQESERVQQLYRGIRPA